MFGPSGFELLSEQHRVEQPAVGRVAAESPRDDRFGTRAGVTCHRGAAEGGLQPGEAAGGGGDPDRADAVGDAEAFMETDLELHDAILVHVADREGKKQPPLSFDDSNPPRRRNPDVSGEQGYGRGYPK